jgi:hypothetical protein
MSILALEFLMERNSHPSLQGGPNMAIIVESGEERFWIPKGTLVWRIGNAD